METCPLYLAEQTLPGILLPWDPQCLLSGGNQLSAQQAGFRGFLTKPAPMGCWILTPALTDVWHKPPKELSSLSPPPLPCSDIGSKVTSKCCRGITGSY